MGRAVESVAGEAAKATGGMKGRKKCGR